MLLATDLDGTFLAGNPDERLRLYQLITRHPDIQLAFVTGRGFESVLPLLSDPTLPQADYIICDVGATVLDYALQPIQPLQSDIAAQWPGEHAVAQALERFPGLVRQDVPQARRCSFYCTPEAVTDELRRVIEDELHCDLLYSADTYLDVMPKGISKGTSLQRLIEQLGIPTEDVLVAGDTLNDLSLFHSEYMGVCVGGSEPRLLEATANLARVLHARRAGCGGILEAMAHFGFMGEKAVEALAPASVIEGKSELVMVYHRLPYEEVRENGRLQRRRPRSPNGIMPTLMSFFGNGIEGSWVAWSVRQGDEPFDTHTAVDAERYPNLTAARVALTQEEVDIFYKSFSKEAFWPTLHTFWERASFREDHWQVYCAVNRKFAEVTAREAASGAVVWIHDYNLWMVPAYLREVRPDLKIAFFHHTYFPSADVFNVLPWRRAIVGSLLQCDYVGFHIPRQVENFVDVARGVAPIETLEQQSCAPRFLTYGCAVGTDQVTTLIRVNNRNVGLGAHPVGLDLDRVRDALKKDAVQQQMAELRKNLSGLRLILSVERLDYTKGTLEKLLAFESLMEDHPELHRKVTLITVCVPAAREMTIYDELQTQIEQAVGRINGRFSQVGWSPVQFFFRSLPFDEIVAYYAMADVMWITTLRDGLNLVAKEFVAVQGCMEGRGVLVLSEFCGAAAELKGAILTNPHDPVELASTVYQGIAMSAAEAKNRLKGLFEIVEVHDLRRWGDDFLSAVKAIEQVPEPGTALEA